MPEREYIVRRGSGYELKYIAMGGRLETVPWSLDLMSPALVEEARLLGQGQEIDVRLERELGINPTRAHLLTEEAGAVIELDAQPQTPVAAPVRADRLDFYNPYSFIPAPPRVIDDPDLGDAGTTGLPELSRVAPGAWSGAISLSMRTVTPLLVHSVQDGESDAVRVRVGPDGRPYLAPTSIKGMLRSAYEAVTNSRFGVWKDQDERLGYRLETRDCRGFVPARVFEDGTLHLLPGESRIGPDGPAGGDRLYAAWLPMSLLSQPKDGSGRLEHGDRIYFRYRENDRHKPWAVIRHLEVTAWARSADALRQESGSLAAGWACVTSTKSGRNAQNKHHERVFFVADGNQASERVFSAAVVDALRPQWQRTIQEYKKANEASIEDGDTGPQSGVFWSRHVDSRTRAGSEQLIAKTVCFARVSGDDENMRIDALYPVALSRALYDLSPHDLLQGTHLEPATKPSELSPAERLFGWVGKAGFALRGRVRIGAAKTDRDDWREPFATALQLQILGQPKPQYPLFYVASDKQGTPLSQGSRKSDGYKNGQGIRGRKTYPHHSSLPERHWADPLDKYDMPEDSGYYPEYLMPGGQDSTQNRSIADWVKPETEFTCTIRVRNLTDVELGALLWLLELEEGFLRLGGGKPLGFGSVRVRVDWEQTTLWPADELTRRYRELTFGEPQGQKPEQVKQTFLSAVQRAYGNLGTGAPESVPFIRDFLLSARGFHGPVHYPRRGTPGQPSPPRLDGRNYEWFVRNNQEGRSAPENNKRPLPSLGSEGGLPFYP